MRRPEAKRPEYFRISILPATGRIVRILAAEQGVSIKDLIERLVHDEEKRAADQRNRP